MRGLGVNLARSLAAFEPPVAVRLASCWPRTGQADVVDVHNPIDASPMAGDASFAALAELCSRRRWWTSASWASFR